ncbi:MAG: response regulator [Micropepsaceae bacterium]
MLKKSRTSARLLFIDDDPVARNYLGAVLEGEPLELCAAENGSQAIAQYITFQPDIVLTDLYMPERDGIETIIELRRLKFAGPIIVVSAGTHHSNVDYSSLVVDLGANDFLAKPFRRAELLEKLFTNLNCRTALSQIS